MVNTQNLLSSLLSNGVSCELTELVRYRALAGKLNLAPSGSIKNSMAGTITSRFKGRGMEFDEARHYQPGDDIRSIDWRVTARTGKTHTKLYREERERPVLIYVDLSASMHFGTQLLYKSVQALHAAALITFSALSRGDKIGCMAVSNNTDIERKPKSTAKQALSMLNQLVDLQKSTIAEAYSEAKQATGKRPAALSSALENSVDKSTYHMNQLAMLARPGTLVYVISDFSGFSGSAYSVLGKINRHCEVRPLRIFDPIEEALPMVNSMQDVLLSDGEQDQHILLGDSKVNEQYKSIRSAVFDALKADLSSLGLPLRQVSAALPIEQQLSASKSGLVLGEFI
ncbi:MAG: hypothetical protein ACJAVV_001975 [Alphaproteobacteria bacterium]|jgi:uncharacterized protein (DUF58 family)